MCVYGIKFSIFVPNYLIFASKVHGLEENMKKPKAKVGPANGNTKNQGKSIKQLVQTSFLAQ